ncbi:response regulator transcription factor, partial [Alicyclobacillus sp.]|uniref:response regulator n=1 Tax=Alicyclobacillus sp. TaxID=61169 RepID=UPI0025C62703
MNPLRILIADDHPIVRAGLVGLLSTQEGFQVVGEASSGLEAVQMADALRPNVVLMDLRMPGMDGTQVVRAVRARHPGLPVVLVQTEVAEYVRAAAERMQSPRLLPGARVLLVCRETDAPALAQIPGLERVLTFRSGASWREFF